MKTLIATTILLGSMSAFAGPYSIKFPKPLILRGNSLISVEKVENKAASGGKWEEKVSNVEKQTCAFTINVEGRDMAIENKAIGEHYYGSMAVACERSGFSAGSFKTNFSRVLLLGIRECVVSETVIDTDYCNLEVIALRRESDLNGENGDLISDKAKVRKFYRIHSENAKKYVEANNLLPSGVNKNLMDSYQAFTLSIGRNGNEFFMPAKNENSSFVSGRNIFLKVAAEDLDRDVELRNTIEKNLSELHTKVGEITTGAKPQEEFKKQIPMIISKFSTSVQSLLGIISPVEFFHLEKQLKEFERNLIATAKTFNPNITSRDSFKVSYGDAGGSLAVMMDYLGERNKKVESTDKTPAKTTETDFKGTREAGLSSLPGMDQEEFNRNLTAFYRVREYSMSTYNFYDRNNMSFAQFKMFLSLIGNTQLEVDILSMFYFKNHELMTRSDFNEVLSLMKNATTQQNELKQHWNVLYPNR